MTYASLVSTPGINSHSPFTTLHSSSIFGVLLVYTVGTVLGFFYLPFYQNGLAVSKILYFVNRLEHMPKFYVVVLQNA